MSIEVEAMFGGAYTGMWKRDLREGQGVMKWHGDNTEFTGEWKLDMRLRGQMTLENGSVY